MPRSVLFVLPTLHGGGAEKVIITLLRHLDRRRFRLALAVVDLRGQVHKDDIPEDVEVISLGSKRVRHAIPGLVSLAWRRRPEVVFSTLSHLNLALALARPALPSRTRIVVRETSIVSRELEAMHWQPVWRALYRNVYPKVDLLVNQSQAMMDDLVRNFRFPSGKALVIHNPIDIRRARFLAEDEAVDPRFDPHRLNLLAAGRLVPVKGFDLLLRAIALCPDRRLSLTVLGEGPLRADLEQLALKLGISEHVRFLGFQRNPYPYYLRTDWFVLSSHYEGFPNAALDALSCGTPVVAVPALGGLTELVAEGIPARIAETVSAEALAACLSHLPKRKEPVSDACVAKFSVEQIVPQFEHVLS